MSKMNKLSLLPTLITLGNGIAGLLAILYIGLYISEQNHQTSGFDMGDFKHLVTAAWLILLGLVFDGVDGKIARMTGSQSKFGAELDSLSDMITFGVAPALIVASMHYGATHSYWGKAVWIFSIAYSACALLRLARYNVEQGLPDEKYHLDFKGTPSPAAGGLIASLTILLGYLTNESDRSQSLWLLFGSEFIESLVLVLIYALPVIAALLAYLMVSSRIRYTHFLNSLMRRRHNFDYLAYLILGALVLYFFREITLVLIFLIYVLSGPVTFLIRDTLKLIDQKPNTREQPNRALLALGSNMGSRKRNLRMALKMLREHPSITLERKSRFIKTKPAEGAEGQRDFLNGATLIRTSLKPNDLLAVTQGIEKKLKRNRKEKHEARPIDIDILLYDDLVINDEDLVIPHPRMCDRAFVLKPASEIAPSLIHPTEGEPVKAIFKKLKRKNLDDNLE